MCKFLNISRSLVYYVPKPVTKDTKLENEIIRIFKDSKNNYGSRKIKVELTKVGYQVSLRRIRTIMNDNGLVSSYTVKQYKKTSKACNNQDVSNILNREFNERKPLEVAISDLTYVNVAGRWHYVCLIIDIFNREVIGFSAGRNKSSALVVEAFTNTKYNLNHINLFHTDRGSEFKNKVIDAILKHFNIKRSLSNKGNPYDNAIAEATYKIFKTEFCNNRKFDCLEHLKRELFDYVNWYNNSRIHGSLNYLTPTEYRLVHI